VEDISLHILDIVENSIRARASKINIKIVEDTKEDLLTVEIKDNGNGMDKETLNKVLDPFFTTKISRKVGLGLALFKQSAIESGGDLEIQSEVGIGTTVKAVFNYSHIDRKPLGDMAATLVTLIAGNREINFVYEHITDESVYRIDTEEIRSGNDLDSKNTVKTRTKKIHSEVAKP